MRQDRRLAADRPMRGMRAGAGRKVGGGMAGEPASSARAATYVRDRNIVNPNAGDDLDFLAVEQVHGGFPIFAEGDAALGKGAVGDAVEQGQRGVAVIGFSFEGEAAPVLPKPQTAV